MRVGQLEIDETYLKDFCERWGVLEFSIFGSALREDFRDDSDVDIAVALSPARVYSAFEIVRMQNELAERLGRTVDLLERSAVTNPIVKRAVDRAVTIYAA